MCLFSLQTSALARTNFGALTEYDFFLALASLFCLFTFVYLPVNRSFIHFRLLASLLFPICVSGDGDETARRGQFLAAPGSESGHQCDESLKEPAPCWRQAPAGREGAAFEEK